MKKNIITIIICYTSVVNIIYDFCGIKRHHD